MDVRFLLTIAIWGFPTVTITENDIYETEYENY